MRQLYFPEQTQWNVSLQLCTKLKTERGSNKQVFMGLWRHSTFKSFSNLSKASQRRHYHVTRKNYAKFLLLTYCVKNDAFLSSVWNLGKIKMFWYLNELLCRMISSKLHHHHAKVVSIDLFWVFLCLFRTMEYITNQTKFLPHPSPPLSFSSTQLFLYWQ